MPLPSYQFQLLAGWCLQGDSFGTEERALNAVWFLGTDGHSPRSTLRKWKGGGHAAGR